MTHEQFTERRERLAKRAAERAKAQTEALRRAVGDRPYDAERLTPLEDELLYALVRNDPIALAEELRHEHKVRGLAPGLLPRRFIERLVAAERRYRERAAKGGQLDQLD